MHRAVKVRAVHLDSSTSLTGRLLARPAAGAPMPPLYQVALRLSDRSAIEQWCHDAASACDFKLQLMSFNQGTKLPSESESAAAP